MRRRIVPLSLLMGFILAPNPAHSVGSAGFTNQVVGSRALGMGNSFVATADDPSAVFFNPAGLTQLDQPALSYGMAPVLVDVDYAPPTGSRDNTDNFLPVVPNFYAATPLDGERWVLGFGVNAPYGLESHWSDTGPLRYVATDSALLFIHANPTVAYKVNERFSVGGGLAYGMAKLTLEGRLNLSGLNTALSGMPTVSPDGFREYTGMGDGWGYNLGGLYRIGERHRLGFSYRSKIKLHFNGETKFSGLTGATATLFGGPEYKVDADTDLDIPETFTIGYAFRPGKWIFEIDGEWAGYSTNDNGFFTFTNESRPDRLAVLNTDNPADRDWRNTWNLGLGANYRFNERWEGRGGFFHYPRAIPNRTWDPIIGESSKDGFTVGGSYNTPSFTIDFMYGLILFDERRVDNNVGASSGATVDGTYETVVNVVSINFTHRFGG